MFVREIGTELGKLVQKLWGKGKDWDQNLNHSEMLQ